MASDSGAYDIATAEALRKVYDAAWGKRDEENKFYEEVVVTVLASSSIGSPSEEYRAKFLRVDGVQYFTQLVRAEKDIVLTAVDHAMSRYADRSSRTWSYGSSIIVGQTGVGKSMCLRHALVERLLDAKPTIYLDEAAHVLAVYTASGCCVFRTVDPKGTLCDLRTGQAWALLSEWVVNEEEEDPVAAEVMLADRLTIAALIDSDPARPCPPLGLVSIHAGWVKVQATSTPPLDYQGNNSWAHEERADTIWMDVWSWPEVYAACVHLYGFDAGRLEQAREVFVHATPTLEHCVEFSQSPDTVRMLRDWVRARATSFVPTPNGLRISHRLLRTHEHDRPEDASAFSLACIDRFSVRVSWLYGVLDPDSEYRDNHRGRAASAVTTRVVRPYIMFPRRCERVGCDIALRSVARLQIAGDDGREAIRLALAEVEAIQHAQRAPFSPPSSALPPAAAASCGTVFLSRNEERMDRQKRVCARNGTSTSSFTG